jgi:prephenate dehydrogenase
MKVGVYGLGRFGHFWAGSLAQHFSVTAYSRSSGRQTPEGVRRVSEDELLQSPVLFICTAISAFEEVIGKIGEKLLPGTLLIDTCSVKTHPVAVMERYVSEGVEILATHPMFGPDSARDGFDGLPMVLCPVRIEDKRLAKWKAFFQSLGLRVMIMTPQQHDREAAFTQGITHFVGRVLADLDLQESSMATLGYRKLLEIREQTCNDPWQLFLDLQRFNPYTEEMRQRLGRSLMRILEQLDG